MKISEKILIGFGVVLAFFSIVTIINIFQFKRIKADANAYTKSENVLQGSTRLILLSSGIESAVRGYMFGSSPRLKDTFYAMDKSFTDMLKNERERISRNTTQVKQLDSILSLYNNWRSTFAIPLIGVRDMYLEGKLDLEEYDKAIAIRLVQNDENDKMDAIKLLFFRLAREEYRQIDERAVIVDRSLYWSSFINVALMVLAFAFSAGIAIFLTRNIVSRIYQFSKAMQSVAEGEFKRKVDDNINDELSVLKNAFNAMTNTLNISFDELKRSNEELEQFTWVASHDLKEPLRMISIYSQKIQGEYGDILSESGKESLQFMSQGVQRMYEVINSLLEYSVLKRDDLNFQSVSPHKAIQDAEKRLQDLIWQSKAHITVNHLPQKICAAYILIVEVFFQLIKNAIIFCECDIPEIEISSWQKNDRHIFSVKDNGIGIEKEYSERIFMIFQRLHPKDNYPGAGLGLTLCKKIIRLHGGEIWLHSEPGKGSTFFFDLPVAEKADSFRLPENN